MQAARKFRLKKGDLVEVIAGKDKGKRGKITEVLHKVDRVLVEGVNVVTRHVKPSQTNPQGGVTSQEAAVHVSNVMLVDPETGKPTRVGRKFLEKKKGKGGRWVRVAKKSGTQLEEKRA